MTTRHIRRFLNGGVAVFALVASACASSPPHPSALPSGAPTLAAVDIARLHLPIEAYMLTPTLSVQRDRVASVIVSRCMRGYGFSYPAGAYSADDDNARNAYTVLFRRYGVTDAQSVRVWGYHVPRSDPAARVPDAAKPTLSDAELGVLSGTDPRSGASVTVYAERPVPVGGCMSRPGQIIPYGDDLQGPGTGTGEIVTTIKSDSFAEALADPRVTSVITAWSACMRSHGYSLDSPLAAAADLPSMDDAEPSPTEIARAEADVACKADTNLVGIWFAVESDYENAAIHSNLTALNLLKPMRDAEAAAIARLFATYQS